MRGFTQNQIDLIVMHYPNMPMPELTKLVGKSIHSIYNKAYALGIKHSQEFLDSPAGCRLRRGDEVGKQFRFPKGHVPANKGIKGTSHEGCKATQFVKGSKPANYRPVGTIRFIRDKTDGYYEMKMADGMNQWKLLHRVIWERLNGHIPKGYIVVFLDNNPKNIKITNLSLFTKAQNMLRNTVHNYPKEIVHLVQLKAALNRQINKRTNHEQPRP